MSYFTHQITDLGVTRYQVNVYHKEFMDIPLLTIEKTVGKPLKYTWRDDHLSSFEAMLLADYVQSIQTEVLG